MLNTKATFFVVNHVYDNVGGMGDTLKIPGGRKIEFNSEAIVLGRSRAKEKKSASDPTIIGYIITAETYKSRWSKQNSKLKFRIKVDGGLDIFYGILDDAIEAGVVVKPKAGYYSRPCVPNDKEFKENAIYNSDFWLPIFKDTEFKQWLEEKYTHNDTLDISTETDGLNLMTEEVKKAQTKKKVK